MTNIIKSTTEINKSCNNNLVLLKAQSPFINGLYSKGILNAVHRSESGLDVVEDVVFLQVPVDLLMAKGLGFCLDSCSFVVGF